MYSLAVVTQARPAQLGRGGVLRCCLLGECIPGSAWHSHLRASEGGGQRHRLHQSGRPRATPASHPHEKGATRTVRALPVGSGSPIKPLPDLECEKAITSRTAYSAVRTSTRVCASRVQDASLSCADAAQLTHGRGADLTAKLG